MAGPLIASKTSDGSFCARNPDRMRHGSEPLHAINENSTHGWQPVLDGPPSLSHSAADLVAVHTIDVQPPNLLPIAREVGDLRLDAILEIALIRGSRPGGVLGEGNARSQAPAEID